MVVRLYPCPALSEDTPTIHLRHYKQSVSHEVHRKTVRDVSREDADSRTDNWQELVIIFVENSTYCQPMMKKWEHFADTCGGHFGRMEAARHRIELTSPQFRLIHLAPYIAVPEALVFEKEELYKKIKTGVVYPAGTDCAAPIVFAPKRDGTLQLCVHYCKLNAVHLGNA